MNPHSIVSLNVKDLLARSRRHIWSLSDSNVIRIHNQIVRKWTFNYLAKLAWSVWLNGKVYVYELSDCGFESRCHIKSVFIIYPSRGLSKYIKLRCWPLTFTLYKAFLKDRNISVTRLPVSFSAWFLEKNTFFVMFYTLTKFICLVVFTSWDVGQYANCNYFLSTLWYKVWSQP